MPKYCEGGHGTCLQTEEHTRHRIKGQAPISSRWWRDGRTKGRSILPLRSPMFHSHHPDLWLRKQDHITICTMICHGGTISGRRNISEKESAHPCNGL